MTAIDPNAALLVLVADDPLAPKVVAWWRSAEPTESDLKDEAYILRAAQILKAPSEFELALTIDRCRLATLVNDDGVTALGIQFIETATSGALRSLSKRTARRKS